MIQQFHFCVQKNWKQRLKQIFAYLCLWQHYSQWPKVKTVEMSINKWIYKQYMVSTCYGILFNLKNGKRFWHVRIWMDLEDIILPEISQTQKDKLYGPAYIRDLLDTNIPLFFPHPLATTSTICLRIWLAKYIESRWILACQIHRE